MGESEATSLAASGTHTDPLQHQRDFLLAGQLRFGCRPRAWACLLVLLHFDGVSQGLADPLFRPLVVETSAQR